MVWYKLPMPSADKDMKAFKRRYGFNVSNRLEPAVIKAKGGEEGGEMQLLTELEIKVFPRDLCEGKKLEELLPKLEGLTPMIRKLIDGIYVVYEDGKPVEELPLVDKNGASVRMPCYFLDPDDRDGGKFVRAESFTMRDLSYFLHSGEYREPRKINQRDWTPFRQAVGGQIEQAKDGDDEHKSRRVFTGTVFGRYPYTPETVEHEGRRVAMIHSENVFTHGYLAFIPAKSVTLLQNLFLSVEPFFQNVVAHWSGFSQRSEERVRGFLPAPREAPKPREDKPKRNRKSRKTEAEAQVKPAAETETPTEPETGDAPSSAEA
jgi:hypothetical protein